MSGNNFEIPDDLSSLFDSGPAPKEDAPVRPNAAGNGATSKDTTGKDAAGKDAADDGLGDLEAQLAEASETLALVITPARSPRHIAMALKLGQVEEKDTYVIGTRSGALVARYGTYQEGQTLVQALSALLNSTAVLGVLKRDGQAETHRWTNGEQGPDVPLALVLNGLDPVAEQLVLGKLRPEQVDGAIAMERFNPDGKGHSFGDLFGGFKRKRGKGPEDAQ